MFYEPIYEYEGCKLVKRPDTKHYAIYHYVPHLRRTRRKSTGTSNLEEAKRRLIDYADERRPGARPPPHRVPLIQLMCAYVESLGHRPGRVAAATALKHVLAFCDAESISFVAEFTPKLQAKFIDWRRATLLAQGFSASNGTIQRDLGAVRAAIRYAWKNGEISEVPPIRSVPSPPPRQRYLSAEEANRLITACQTPHLTLFVTMALHTLQRPGAILDLTVEQIDLERRRIDFNPPQRERTRKGRAVVPITNTLMPLLEDAMAHSVSGFVIEWDGKPIRNVITAFRRARRQAGLGADVSPYTLRHTGATLLAAKGVPMRQIAGMLGHTDSKTTEAHYAKHSPDFMGEACTALDDLFSSDDSSTPPTTPDEHHG